MREALNLINKIFDSMHSYKDGPLSDLYIVVQCEGDGRQIETTIEDVKREGSKIILCEFPQE